MTIQTYQIENLYTEIVSRTQEIANQLKSTNLKDEQRDELEKELNNLQSLFKPLYKTLQYYQNKDKKKK